MAVPTVITAFRPVLLGQLKGVARIATGLLGAPPFLHLRSHVAAPEPPEGDPARRQRSGEEDPRHAQRRRRGVHTQIHRSRSRPLAWHDDWVSNLCGHVLEDGSLCCQPIAEPGQRTCGRHGASVLPSAPPSLPADRTSQAQLGTRWHPVVYEECRLWWDPTQKATGTHLPSGWQCLVHRPDGRQTIDTAGGPKRPCEERPMDEAIVEHSAELELGAVITVLVRMDQHDLELFARRRALTEPLVEWLRQQAGMPIMEQVAENPATPAASLRALFQDDEVTDEVGRLALANPSMPVEVMWGVVRTSRNAQTWAAIAANPAAPIKILKRMMHRRWLLDGSSQMIVKYWLGANPNTPPRVLRRLVVDGMSRYGAMGVARNPAAPDKLLARLARSKDGDVARPAQHNLESRRRGETPDFGWFPKPFLA